MNHSQMMTTPSSHAVHTTTEDRTKAYYFGGYFGTSDWDRAINIVDSMIAPAIAIIGLFGNALSLLVLKRHGLHKSSNILLFSLAIADIVFLAGKLDITSLVYDNGPYIGWPGPYKLAKAFYILYQFHYVCYYVGHFCSMTYPALITTERLIALFFPLKFKTIVTPARTCMAIGFCTLLGVTFGVGMAFMTIELEYTFYPPYNTTVGIKMFSRLAMTTDIRNIYMMFFQVTEGIVPLIYVVLGCIVIHIKMKLLSSKRSQITATNATLETRKTSIMLFTVCVLYIVCSGFYSILKYVPQWEIIRKISNFDEVLLVTNSSANFIIYVAVNKNFRETYISLITCKPETKGKLEAASA